MAGYALVFGAAVVARLLLALVTVPYVSAGQEAVWSWWFFAVFSACFIAAVVLASSTKLRTPTETVTTAHHGLALAVAVGLAVALLTIASDVVSPVAPARGVATIHIHGWVSVPFYAYGAILLTTVFHFLPIAAAAWVAQRLQGNLRIALVALGVAAVALSEDVGYFLRSASPPSVEGARHALSVAANGTEGFFIYRFGFLAGLAQRSATYLLWHVAWPSLQ